MSSSHTSNLQGEEALMDAMLFQSSFVFPMVLHTAIELDLFNIIAKAGPGAYVSASEIASNLPTKNPDAASVLDRVLTLLATHSFLSYSKRTKEDGRIEKLYGLTPASRYFLGGDHEEGSTAALSYVSHHPATIQVWLRMKEVILEGGDLFKKVHGVGFFEYTMKDPKLNSIFNEAMTASAKLVMKSTLEVYKGFEGLNSLVDVGGGSGKALNMIISKYPSIKGINFDLPHVIKQSAFPYIGVEHVGGDMFEYVPTADAIMMKRISHDWNDESLRKILHNICKALPDKGKLIIIENIKSEETSSSKDAQLDSRRDNILLVQFGGRGRTAKEFEDNVKVAGFTNFKVACAVRGLGAVMEAYK